MATLEAELADASKLAATLTQQLQQAQQVRWRLLWAWLPASELALGGAGLCCGFA